MRLVKGATQTNHNNLFSIKQRLVKKIGGRTKSIGEDGSEIKKALL